MLVQHAMLQLPESLAEYSCKLAGGSVHQPIPVLYSLASCFPSLQSTVTSLAAATGRPPMPRAKLSRTSPTGATLVSEQGREPRTSEAHQKRAHTSKPHQSEGRWCCQSMPSLHPLCRRRRLWPRVLPVPLCITSPPRCLPAATAIFLQATTLAASAACRSAAALACPMWRSLPTGLAT